MAPVSLSRRHATTATLFGAFGVAALMSAILLVGLLALVDSVAPALTARRLGDSARLEDLSTPARRAAWLASVVRAFETPTGDDDTPGWIGFPIGIHHPASACWASEDGTALISTNPRRFLPGASVTARLTEPEREAWTSLMSGRTSAYGRTFAGPFLAGARAVDAAGKPRGFVLLRSEGRFELDEALDFIRSSRMALGLILLLPVPLVGSALGARFARRWHGGLASVVDTVGRWRTGDLEARMPAAPVTELAPLVRDLDLLADGLRQRESLRRRLALAEARAALAGDLHDAVKQRLFAATMHLAVAKDRLEDGSPARAALDHATAAARGALDELTALLAGGAPIPPPTTPLATRLRALAGGFEAEFGVRVEGDIAELSLGPEADEEIYRIAQEAATNAIRHSGAREIALALRHESHVFRLEVRDLGRGFDPASPPGFGRRSMAERAGRIPGARLRIESAPGSGTCVSVEGPQ